MKFQASLNNDQWALFHCGSPKILLNAIKLFASVVESKRQAWVRRRDNGMYALSFRSYNFPN